MKFKLMMWADEIGHRLNLPRWVVCDRFEHYVNPAVPEDGECYLDDDGLSPEVHAVEAGDDPQALCVRVGPVFYEHGQGKEPGVWIEYQERHMRGPLTGPVLLTPKVWRELNRAVERKLRRREPWWKGVFR